MNEDKMELEEAIEYLEQFICIKKDYKYQPIKIKTMINTREAIKTVLQSLKDSIPKKKIEDELSKRKKAIKPYEEYNKESRQYWIDTGVISYCKELLKDK